MGYYKIWGAPQGFFPRWEDFGWVYGEPRRVSQLFGYLLEAGRASGYMFMVYDANHVPVVPIMPSAPGAPEPPGLPIPGLTFPGAA